MPIRKQPPAANVARPPLPKPLINQPDILLLDEPTNHLDMPTIEQLEKIIAAYNGAVVVISHDRRFLTNVSRTTFWLDRGTMRRNNKGFGSFEDWQDQVIEQEIIAQKYLNKKSPKKRSGCTKASPPAANETWEDCGACNSCGRNGANKSGRSVRSTWILKIPPGVPNWSSSPNICAKLSANG